MVERPFSKRSFWPERRQGRLCAAHPTFLHTPPNGRIGMAWLLVEFCLAQISEPLQKIQSVGAGLHGNRQASSGADMADGRGLRHFASRRLG